MQQRRLPSPIFIILTAFWVTRFDCQQVEPQTYCIGNCKQCPQISQCQVQSSEQFPNQNFNCINFYEGDDCTQFSKGLKVLGQGLEGWEGQSQRFSCSIGGDNIMALGQFSSSVQTNRTFDFDLQDIQVLVVQIGLFFKFQALQPIMIDVEIDAVGFNHILNLFYDLGKLNRNGEGSENWCGGYAQFISSIAVPIGTVLNSVNVKLIPSGDLFSTWSLSKFRLHAGCSGFMVYSNAECNACQSGFYPVRNNDNSLSYCEICPSTCKTCSDNQTCLTCREGTIVESGKCQFSNNYQLVTDYRVVQGQQKSNQYYDKVVITNNNEITISGDLPSQKQYEVNFYLLYLGDVLEGTSGNLSLSEGGNLIESIRYDQLSSVSGFYPINNFGLEPTNTQKIYAKQITIRNLDATPKTSSIANSHDGVFRLTFSSSNTTLRNFGIANFQILQYKCSEHCAECDSVTKQCNKCDSFFEEIPNYSCTVCSNGFFIKKFWDSRYSSSLQVTQPDQCVKCHSSCLQCSGPTLGQCNECFDKFTIYQINYDKLCIQCIYDRFAQSERETPHVCLRCFGIVSYSNVISTGDCSTCLQQASDFEDNFNGRTCKPCWAKVKLLFGRCVPMAATGYEFHGTDVFGGFVDEQSWRKTSGPGDILLKKSALGPEYPNLYGISSIPNSQSDVSFSWSEVELPSHTGVIIFCNIFVSNLQAQEQKNITVEVFGANDDELSRQDITIPRGAGADVDGKPGNEMIYTYYFEMSQHSNQQQLELKISSQGGGVYIRQMEVYLGNCETCASRELRYDIAYIPRYSYNETIDTGLDVWIEFSKEVQVTENTDLRDAFEFNVGEGALKIIPTEFSDEIQDNNRLRYFLPLESTFINSTLYVSTTADQKILARNNTSQVLQGRRRVLLISRLNLPQSVSVFDRFSKVDQNQAFSIGQIYQFFNFCQWFAIIAMIVCAFFGIGVIMEDFSIMLQLLFLHVYISSHLLPATFKAEMWGLARMENLNFFADPHIQQIEDSWFGSGFYYPSPYIFEQYNPDIYFLRSYYPMIIINLIYLCWFLLLLGLRKGVKPFSSSSFAPLLFLKAIPQRPLNYFDQIWRYQFLTTCWAAFMQFYNLNGRNGKEIFNIILCFLAFIISLIWPIFVVVYTYRQNLVQYSTNSLYYYEDIFFNRNETFAQKNWQHYMYIFLRFARILIIALFIALFINHELVSPIVLILANVIEIVYVIQLRIFLKNMLATALKVLENFLFISVEVTLLVVYSFSDSMEENSFLNLGYALVVIYVVMIILAVIRIIYHCYEKFSNYKLNHYGADGGAMKEYGATPLPRTDRD